MQDYKISLRHITKSFPGVKALSDINFDVRKGAVHVIMGENGAGKSTMMKIINGVYHPDSGAIFIDGKQVSIKTPMQATELGIAMIYQELNFVPEFTIEEYLFMGKEPQKGRGIVDWKRLHSEAVRIMEEEGVNYHPGTKIKDITVSDLQILEIIKATTSGAEIIIMDEPTSSISNQEVDRLFQKIEELRKKGITILYISHKLDEIFRIADEITIIRDGAVIETKPASEYDHDTIIAKMVGRSLENVYPEMIHHPGEEYFRVEHLTGGYFQDVSFYAAKGEIIGFAGLVGAGRTEVMRAIVGLDPIKEGKLYKARQEIHNGTVQNAKKNGIAMVSEDRRRYGIIGVRSIRENIALPNLEKVSTYGVIRHRKEKEITQNYFQKLNIKAPSHTTLIQNLSGGNQQKVVLAKWLLAGPDVLILDEPTRGIDVGAKYEIYCLIKEMLAQGTTILMVSSELPELIGMCDRVYVMAEGRITGEVAKQEMTQEAIMRLATGGEKNE
ncbi:MAG: sugar ABC transporter ATP-binding protein [Ruminococcus sp.]|nr:sugar ABC transporter ATP-binding protein [Ruminococcus sp.]